VVTNRCKQELWYAAALVCLATKISSLWCFWDLLQLFLDSYLLSVGYSIKDLLCSLCSVGMYCFYVVDLAWHSTLCLMVMEEKRLPSMQLSTYIKSLLRSFLRVMWQKSSHSHLAVVMFVTLWAVRLILTCQSDILCRIPGMLIFFPCIIDLCNLPFSTLPVNEFESRGSRLSLTKCCVHTVVSNIYCRFKYCRTESSSWKSNRHYSWYCAVAPVWTVIRVDGHGIKLHPHRVKLYGIVCVEYGFMLQNAQHNI